MHKREQFLAIFTAELRTQGLLKPISLQHHFPTHSIRVEIGPPTGMLSGRVNRHTLLSTHNTNQCTFTSNLPAGHTRSLWHMFCTAFALLIHQYTVVLAKVPY